MCYKRYNLQYRLLGIPKKTLINFSSIDDITPCVRRSCSNRSHPASSSCSIRYFGQCLGILLKQKSSLPKPE